MTSYMQTIYLSMKKQNSSALNVLIYFPVLGENSFLIEVMHVIQHSLLPQI